MRSFFCFLALGPLLFASCTGQDPVPSSDAAAPVTDGSSGADSSNVPDASDARPSHVSCARERCSPDQMCCTSSTAFLSEVDSKCEPRAAVCMGGGVAVLCNGAAHCPSQTLCCAFRRYEEAGAFYEYTRVDCVAGSVCTAPNQILCDLGLPSCPAAMKCEAGENGQFGYCK